MNLFLDNKIANLFLTHITIITIFFITYYTLSKDITNFSGMNDSVDVLYFTLGTHSTIGFGDITPQTRKAKLFVILHTICIILLMIDMYYMFLKK